MAESRPMLDSLRGMPLGVRIFLVYGFVLLGFLSVTLPKIIEQAVEAPVSPIGLVWMLLLAYLIFTLTLVFQRKQAAYPLAVGLATLSLPLIPVMYLSPAGFPGAVLAALVSVSIFWALRRPGVHSWFNER
ncbi:MAG: hypothetical protein ABIZ34_01265 [Candidatus Limnocylindrales bacterium]